MGLTFYETINIEGQKNLIFETAHLLPTGVWGSKPHIL